ncbi:aspartate kinase [Gottschalkiaceae bacterium SANA]|nr:aspartate kinase [Gottschalkiaceae bacterium SANA]
MSLIVQKYGGSSVGNIKRIKCVAARITKTAEQGNKVVVAVSAMGDTTDELVSLARAIHPDPPHREFDMLLSTGEQVSISLLAMAIQAQGHDVISLTGAQCGIQTTQIHKKARIESVQTERLNQELGNNKIVIVAGFQGINADNDITTLGRGGSDTTAVALAAALEADKCEIYTDVDGIYTADPRKVETARKLDAISYDEVLEMASLGAQVLHPRSIELARKYQVPLVVRSSFSDNPGTEIIEVNQLEKVSVRGISIDDNIAKITIVEVPDKPGVAFSLFSRLAQKHVRVDTIIQSAHRDTVNDISFTVNDEDKEQALSITTAYAAEIGANRVLHDPDVSKLSVVGTGIAGNTDVAAKLFGSLSDLGINIQMISTSEIKISCIISNVDGLKAMQHLHDVFELGSSSPV